MTEDNVCIHVLNKTMNFILLSTTSITLSALLLLLANKTGVADLEGKVNIAKPVGLG